MNENDIMALSELLARIFYGGLIAKYIFVFKGVAKVVTKSDADKILQIEIGYLFEVNPSTYSVKPLRL